MLANAQVNVPKKIPRGGKKRGKPSKMYSGLNCSEQSSNLADFISFARSLESGAACVTDNLRSSFRALLADVAGSKASLHLIKQSPTLGNTRRSCHNEEL